MDAWLAKEVMETAAAGNVDRLALIAKAQGFPCYLGLVRAAKASLA